MRNPLIISAFLSSPWAILPDHLNAMSDVIARWSYGSDASDDTMQKVAADLSARTIRKQNAASMSSGGIAVLPLYGIVTQRGNMVQDISGPGSTSTQQFSSALRAALEDDAVAQILIEIDSPGGSVFGVSELADEIVSARSKKPICAIANSMAASAAYWIGCSASEFYVTPSGEVGSIGVLAAHIDRSQKLASEGVKTTLISAGKYKVEGSPYAPLDEEAQSFMQTRVDDYYVAFTKGVARGRGVPIAEVRDGMGQGRCLGADAALAAQMVDGVATFEEVILKMLQRQRQAKQAAPQQKSTRLASALRTLDTV